MKVKSKTYSLTILQHNQQKGGGGGAEGSKMAKTLRTFMDAPFSNSFIAASSTFSNAVYFSVTMLHGIKIK